MRLLANVVVISTVLASTWLAFAVQPPSPATQPHPDLSKVDVPLPGAVTATCAGGGGRYLVLEIASNQQLAVFDVRQAKVTGSIPLADPDVVFAASKSKLFVGLKGIRQLQRWDLATQKLEKSVAAPEGGISVLAAAADADGPVVLAGEKRLWQIDPQTLAAERYPSEHWGTDGSAWGPVNVHVAFDGSTVLANGGGWAGIELSNIVDGHIAHVEAGGRTPGNGDVLLSGDGSLTFVEKGEILHDDLKSKAVGIDGQVFPADDRAFSLAFQIGPAKRKGKRKAPAQTGAANAKQEKGPGLTLFSNADPRPLVTLHNLPELAEKSDMPIWQRVHLIPRMEVLITLGEGENHLIMRPFSLTSELDAAGVSYLFVKSSPPPTARKGATYSYQPEVVSKAGDVKFVLQSAPAGMAVDANGAMRWTVKTDAPDSDEMVILQISDASGKSIFQNFRVRVGEPVETGRPQFAGGAAVRNGNSAGADTHSSGVAGIHGNNGGGGQGNAAPAAQADAPAPSYPPELQLNLGTEDAAYTPGLKWNSGLVLQKSQLSLVAADGVRVREHWTLETEYTQICERPAYFVALAKSPGAIDLLDIKTLKRIRRIKLPFPSIFEMASLPYRPLTYVTVGVQADHGAHSCILVVNESTGEVHQPDNAVGNFVAVNASGTRLYSGYKDLYQKGVSLFMNPDGNVWDTPEYGDIDILMIYDLSDPELPKLRAFRDKVGMNGSGIRLSPDGKRITYLSFTGYPDYSKSIPAWDPTDLDKVPITYDCKDKADNRKMNYHQSLPLVIVAGNSGPLIFDRESGDVAPDRVHFPDGFFNGSTLTDTYFSPDGMNAIVKCQRGTDFTLYKAPLKLSPEEIQTVRKGAARLGAPAERHDSRPEEGSPSDNGSPGGKA